MVTAGSLLAQTTNIGNFSRDRFSAVPEVSAKLGYQVTPNIRAFVGYDFMYWTVIIRPGDAIDTTFNPTYSLPSYLPERLALRRDSTPRITGFTAPTLA